MNHIHERTQIGTGTTLGYFSVVEAEVIIGSECRIGHNVVIHSGTTIGDGVRIDDNTVVGKLPMRSVASAPLTEDKELSGANIESYCIIGTAVVIYRGCNISQNVLVADFASIREDVRIGDRTIIGRGVSIENKVTVGKNCKIETEAYISALSSIGDFCFIAPEVTFTNDNFMGRTEERYKHYKGVTIKRGGRVGANATVLPGIVIEEDGMVGAGTVVTKNVPKGQLIYGNPGRSQGIVPEQQLLNNQKIDL